MTETVQTSNASNSVNSSNTNTSSKGKSRDPFLDILRKSRTTFNKQIIRNAEMKKTAIQHVLKLSDKDGNMDNLVFLGNFYDRVNYRLLDSNRFVSDCVNLGLVPFNVAQHVIFDGNKKLDEVLTVGVHKVYGNEILKMKEPIFSKEELGAGKINPIPSGSEDISDNSEGLVA